MSASIISKNTAIVKKKRFSIFIFLFNEIQESEYLSLVLINSIAFIAASNSTNKNKNKYKLDSRRSGVLQYKIKESPAKKKKTANETK
jgi:hypothetical protein